ncbi:hypothetical protein [Methylobacterium gossipiicola]|uniref:Uncharacterized protein n=1 Tax=Methylobacterium gossipiicola TaxID=582675 RepID=A0A1I2SDD7_9HYPH|nr:hypothetical protein [Methylobacterium gossipiicola]SFG49739.1 hypothetical protein SAMN05192565_104128 [Methylobacterium gossipiicola]
MIELHPDDIRATVVPLFQNAEWTVLPDGLEHRASGYFIDRDVIGMRRGDLWEWPLQLAEKSWCRPLPLREAFVAALNAFAIPRDANLAASFATGFGLKAGPGSVKAADDFVILGDVLRPKRQTSNAVRKRASASEGRVSGRGGRLSAPQRAADVSGQRAAL